MKSESNKFWLCNTVALIILAMVFLSTYNRSESSVRRSLKTWHLIDPYRNATTLIASCNRADPAAYLDRSSRLVTPATIRVGHAYSFDPYTFWTVAKSGLDLFWNPNKVIAKRTFQLYDLEKFSKEHWENISRSPTIMTAVFVRSGEGYFGTPVKWNSEYTKVVYNVLDCAEAKKDAKNAILSALAREIIIKGILSTGPDVGSSEIISESPDIAAIINKIETFSERQDIQAVSESFTKFYLGFSDTPVDFGLKPADRLITRSGALGQPLGTVMPSWPSEDPEIDYHG